MKDLAMTKMAWVNVAFVVLGLLLPQTKDILTPEFEISLVATINGLVALSNRYQESKAGPEA